MQRRRLALLALVAIPVGVAWIACSVPSRDIETATLTCYRGCPEIDASFDGAGGTPDAIAPNNTDNQGSERNVPLCGPASVDGGTLCAPDLGQGDQGDAGCQEGQSCQVVRSTAVIARTACGTTGQAHEGEACGGDVVTAVDGGDGGLPASDCGPGLACVRLAPNAPGQCQRYCCLFSTACQPGYWCAQRPFFESVGAPFSQQVPVCIKGDGCTLLEPGQCPNTANEDLAPVCVLAAPQTTACDVIGPNNGREGQDCPCAEGYACIAATKTCRKICHLGADSECPSGTCTGGGDVLPPGFGLCVTSG